jgi:hypothetical protein
MDASVGEGLRQALFGYGATMIVSALSAGLIWAVVYVLDHLHKRRTAAADAMPVQVKVAPVPPPVDESARIAAVIGAAVYAVLGAHRLVYIGEGRPNVGWSTTGRAIHQTSHMPRRAPKG